MTNSAVRKLKYKDEGIVNFLNDIALGKSKAMFSKETDIESKKRIKDKYELNDFWFDKYFEIVLNNGKLKNKELQHDLEQVINDIGHEGYYSGKVASIRFREGMILRRTYLDKNGDSIFDKEFYENNFVKEKATKEDVEAGLAKKIGDRIEYLTREEVKKFLDSLQDLKLSFIHSDTGKLVDKKGYEEFAKQWANYYKFWGEFGAELSTRRRGANLTKFFEQILWIAPRTTGEGKSFDLIGSSNKKNKTIHFNIDKVK